MSVSNFTKWFSMVTNQPYRWSSRWPPRAAAVLVSLALFVPAAADGEIIIDDFDQPFEIPLPEMMNRPYIIQQNIGPMDVERWSDVVAFSSRPSGLVDPNVSLSSSLVVEIDRLHPINDGFQPTVTTNLLYFFGELDITEGGLNDRIVVDFGHLHSAIPMAQVTVFVQDASQPGTSYGRQMTDISPHDRPFSLVFPLASFGGRGGGSERIDFQSVYRLSLHVSPIRFTDIDEINFSTSIERIRITSAIPEPNAGAVCFSGILGTFCFSVRKRRRRDEVPSKFFIGSCNFRPNLDD